MYVHDLFLFGKVEFWMKSGSEGEKDAFEEEGEENRALMSTENGDVEEGSKISERPSGGRT